MFAISFSKIDMYKRCPKLYYFYSDPRIREAYRTAKPYLTMGDNVHRTLRDFFKLNLKERTLPKLKNILEERWKYNRTGFKNKEEEKQFYERALKQLENFYNNPDATKEPFILPEKLLRTTIDSDFQVIGRIDRIDRENEGLHIIDYKTGLKSEESVDRTQLNLYALIAAENYNRKVKKVSYYYLEEDKFVTHRPTTEEINNTVLEVKNIVTEIRSKPEFPAKPNRFCYNCDYLDICPRKREILA